MFNKGHDSKVTINMRNYLKVMYKGKEVDYDKIVYKVTPDYDNNRLVVTLKQKKEGD